MRPLYILLIFALRSLCAARPGPAQGPARLWAGCRPRPLQRLPASAPCWPIRWQNHCPSPKASGPGPSIVVGPTPPSGAARNNRPRRAALTLLTRAENFGLLPSLYQGVSRLEELGGVKCFLWGVSRANTPILDEGARAAREHTHNTSPNRALRLRAQLVLLKAAGRASREGGARGGPVPRGRERLDEAPPGRRPYRIETQAGPRPQAAVDPGAGRSGRAGGCVAQPPAHRPGRGGVGGPASRRWPGRGPGHGSCFLTGLGGRSGFKRTRRRATGRPGPVRCAAQRERSAEPERLARAGELPLPPRPNIAETVRRHPKGGWLRPEDHRGNDELARATNRCPAAFGKQLRIQFSPFSAN